MLNLEDIVNGHVKELFNSEEELSESRMKICRACPIFKNTLGGICDSKLWFDPLTNDVSNTKKIGYIKGCGCRLRAKTRLPQSFCVAGKW